MGLPRLGRAGNFSQQVPLHIPNMCKKEAFSKSNPKPFLLPQSPFVEWASCQGLSTHLRPAQVLRLAAELW